jgi:hypothetical protein
MMMRLRVTGEALLHGLLVAALLLPVPVRLVAQAGSRHGGGVPFDIDQRPQPQGSDLATLLPLRVGRFIRAPLPPDAHPRPDEDLNTTYTADGDSIFLGFSLPESLADAQAAVTTTRDEAIASKVDVRGAGYRVGKDPSYFKTEKFMAWTRGRYFYYVNANRMGALEHFMRAFPY